MRIRISDLCILVAAMALGARFSLLVSGWLPWPFDITLFRAMFLGGVVLCPLLLLKQVVIDHRRIRLLFGEWLWIVFVLWFTTAWFFLYIGNGVLGLSILIYGGVLIQPVLFCCACVNLALLFRSRGNKPGDWNRVFGCLMAAILSLASIWFLFHLPKF
jgi:hypothetical protein